jgi:hypothetical protein
MASPYLGYALLAVGLIMLVFTFLLGYGIYQNAISGGMTPSTGNISGNNITAVVGSALQSVTSPLNSTIYIAISIAILFLFANIGYKMAMIGIKILDSNGKEEKREK